MRMLDGIPSKLSAVRLICCFFLSFPIGVSEAWQLDDVVEKTTMNENNFQQNKTKNLLTLANLIILVIM